MMNKVLAGTLAILAGISLQGCDDRTIAFGAGVVGGAIVAGAVFDDNDNNRYERRRSNNRCYDRYDGRYCRRGGKWKRNKRWNDRPYTVVTADMALMVGNTKAANALAKKYALSAPAAGYLMDVLNQVKADGNPKHWRALGLSDSDLEQVASGKLPSIASRAELAANLATSEASVTALLTDVSHEYTLQQQHNWKLQ